MEKVPQVCIVPLTINYERVFEGDVLNELSGEKKTAGSLLNLIKATPKMMGSYGRVYVEICKPILGR
jgi:glycerol-3-phosphate O-acyltransferase